MCDSLFPHRTLRVPTLVCEIDASLLLLHARMNTASVFEIEVPTAGVMNFRNLGGCRGAGIDWQLR